MQVFSVTQFLAYINDTFKAIWDPHEVALEGEVSGFRISQGQWVNFDVKDTEALVSVFMVLRNLTLPLQDGMRVRLFGYPRVYPKYGKFSFSADRVELIGEGSLRKALALLREKLTAEGLFDPARKRPLPRFPERIALVASLESAAYGDFIRILSERWGGLEIDSYHVLVQGEKAPDEIVRAIQTAQAKTYDALVLTRGGGSLEELMVFNDERVARALFASKIPTLVGIGHERDLTIAEEVADVRGSTPTDCARRLVPDRKEILFEVATAQGRIAEQMEAMAAECLRRVDDGLRRVDVWLQAMHTKLETLERVLRSLSPRAVLERGYAVVTDVAGCVCTSIKGLAAGSLLRVRLRDGSVDTLVRSVKSIKSSSP